MSVTLRGIQPEAFLHFLGCSPYCRNSMIENTGGFETVTLSNWYLAPD